LFGMKPIILMAAALAAFPATAARPSDAERLDRLLAGRVAGEPVSCLPTSRYQDTRTYDGTVAYKVGGTWYVNRFAAGCPQLRNGRSTISRHVNRVCRGDIAEVVLPQQPAISYGACSFADFTPYRKPRR
jgi:hypothetical protein